MATYLGYVSSGQELILKTRDKGSFVIRKVKDDDTLMSKEEFFAKIEEAERQIEPNHGKKPWPSKRQPWQ